MAPTPFLAPLLALALGLAGCAAPDAATEAATAPTAEATPPLPPPLEGRVWLPPSQGQDRAETLVPVPDVHAGDTLRAQVTLGGTYGVETPPLLADVVVELRDAAGTVLASAQLSMSEPEAQLEAVAEVAGEAALAVLSYGGSDGSANGDWVDYVVEITR